MSKSKQPEMIQAMDAEPRIQGRVSEGRSGPEGALIVGSGLETG